MGLKNTWSARIRNHTDGNYSTVEGTTDNASTPQGKDAVAEHVQAAFRKTGQRVTAYDVEIHD